MDQKLWDLEDRVLELNVPEPVHLPLFEFDHSIPKLCHTVNELLLPLVGDLVGVRLSL